MKPIKFVEVMYRTDRGLFDTVGVGVPSVFQECERAQFVSGDVLVIVREDDFKKLQAAAAELDAIHASVKETYGVNLGELKSA